jgi:hypothetical protein
MSTQPAPISHHSALLRDPHARLAAALVVSLLLWIPFGMAAARGELDVVSAGLRFLVAFLGCRFAVGGIAHLVATYHEAHLVTAATLAPVPAADRRTAGSIGTLVDQPAEGSDDR